MATAQMDSVIRHLHRVVLHQDGAGRTDGQLLASFIDQKDEAAFEALVRRHGPMVFGVCRRVVGNHHDAEDAFQATFLVLARKAASVRPRERVANWLHGVALRTAMKARTMTAKRRGREKQVTDLPEPEAAQPDQWRDVLPLLDQELNGLPENYRLPILLCDLESKTIKDAAQQLGWPQGTVAGRLVRGRKLLAKRLASRGVVQSAGSLAVIVSQNSVSAGVPISLVSSTIKAAAMIAEGQVAVAGVLPAKVAILTEGMLKTMLLNKLKTATALLLLFAALGGGAGLLYRTPAAEQPKAQVESEKADKGKQPANKGRLENDQTPRKNLEGVWAVVSVEDNDKNKLDFDPIFSHVAGTQAPVRNARLAFRDTKFVLKTGLVSLEGSYFVDSSVTPKVIILSITTESGELLSISGVYSLDRDNLSITFGGLPASQVAGLAGKEPGVCYMLRRESLPNERDRQSADQATGLSPITPAYVVAPPDILRLEVSGLPKELEAIDGEYLVRPDGTISLGAYGSLYVAGQSLGQIRAAITDHLAKLSVDVLVDVAGYNSRKYYVINKRQDGDQVHRFTDTGGETVVGAILRVDGLASVAAKGRVWLARPSGGVLEVDWRAITQKGKSDTNYYIRSGDRVYVE